MFVLGGVFRDRRDLCYNTLWLRPKATLLIFSIFISLQQSSFCSTWQMHASSISLLARLNCFSLFRSLFIALFCSRLAFFCLLTLGHFRNTQRGFSCCSSVYMTFSLTDKQWWFKTIKGICTSPCDTANKSNKI